MRSFLLASFALCLAWVVSGCDAPVEPKKETPPVAEKPADKPEGGKMEPAPAPAPEKPADKPADAPK
jgi:hypothetical protein